VCKIKGDGIGVDFQLQEDRPEDNFTPNLPQQNERANDITEL
jgi:hypothetical protein